MQMELELIGSSAAGHAKTSALRVRDLAWTAHAQDYGRKSPVWLAKLDPEDCSWRTRQTSLLSTKAATLAECSQTWPRSGTMRNGTAYRLPPLTHPTSVIACGSSQLVPTPTCRDWKDGTAEACKNVPVNGLLVRVVHHMWPTIHGTAKESYKRRQGPSGNELGRAVLEQERLWPTPRATDGSHGGRVTPRKAKNGGNLIEAVSMDLYPTPTSSRRSGLQSHGENVISGSLNPDWVEWLQGLPIGWTALAPSETATRRKSSKR